MARRGGLSLVEVLVTIGIIGLVAALVLPAVQAAREASRRSTCAASMRQIGIAIQLYAETYHSFPYGLADHGFSFHSSILNGLEESAIASRIDDSRGPYDPVNVAAASMIIPRLRCPSDWPQIPSATNYAANFGTGLLLHGFDGAFRPMHGLGYDGDPRGVFTITSASFTDGLSHTAAVSELLIGNGDRMAGRAEFYPPRGANIATFLGACASLRAPLPAAYRIRGRLWTYGDISMTGYNHMLTPNNNSCVYGGDVQAGAYSAISLHPEGVNLLHADGHVSFIVEHIAMGAWSALGSRNGGDGGAE